VVPVPVPVPVPPGLGPGPGPKFCFSRDRDGTGTEVLFFTGTGPGLNLPSGPVNFYQVLDYTFFCLLFFFNQEFMILSRIIKKAFMNSYFHFKNRSCFIDSSDF